MKSLKHRAIGGVAWSAVERFSTQGISFLLGIFIARLVAPEEYGLIAMLAIFIDIAQSFVDSGFSNALIQKKDRKSIDFSTVFYFNIIISLIVYGILYLLAPSISSFYNEPILVVVCRILGLDIVITSLALVQRTILQIDIDFKRLTKISLLATVLSGVLGLFLAWKGFGIWALLIQRITNTIFQVILLWSTSSWRPQFIFSIASFKVLFSFGSRLMLGGLLHTIYLNLYPLIIGRFFNSVSVGFFTRAQQLGVFPSNNVTYIIKRVTYPLLCTMQDDDRKMEEAQFRIMRLTAFVVFPLMVGLAVLAEPVITILLTAKWLPAAPMLSLLCCAYMWFPIMSLNDQLLSIKGRSDLSLKAEVIKKIVAIVLLVLAVPLGIKAVCVSLIVYAFFDMIIILLFVRKISSIGFMSEMKVLFPICIVTAIMGVCVWIVKEIVITPVLILLVGTLVGCIVYLSLIYFFRLRERAFLHYLLLKLK